jgi:hypothetical protein
MTLPALSLLRLESYDTQVANQTASLVSVGANSMYKPLIVNYQTKSVPTGLNVNVRVPVKFTISGTG